MADNTFTITVDGKQVTEKVPSQQPAQTWAQSPSMSQAAAGNPVRYVPAHDDQGRPIGGDVVIPRSAEDTNKYIPVHDDQGRPTGGYVVVSLTDYTKPDDATLAQEGVTKINGVSGTDTSKLYGGIPTSPTIEALAGTLPSSELTAIGLKAITSAASGQKGSDFFVKLEPLQGNADPVILEITPVIGESRSADYTPVDITHHPGNIIKYQKTNSRDWRISDIKLVSQSKASAQKNQNILNNIRSWVMPFYGSGTQQSMGENMLGAPPVIIQFSAYGLHNIGPIPTVLISYDTSWPADVDYIESLSGEPFPVVMTLSLTLKEAYSPQQYSGFDLLAYRQGNLATAYLPPKYAEQVGTAVTGKEAEVVKPASETTPTSPGGDIPASPTAEPIMSVKTNNQQPPLGIPANPVDNVIGKNPLTLSTAGPIVPSVADPLAKKDERNLNSIMFQKPSTGSMAQAQPDVPTVPKYNDIPIPTS